MVSLLLDWGAGADFRTVKGKAALHLAVEHREETLVAVPLGRIGGFF